MTRTKQPKMAVCHPTLPAYAKGLCRKCYDSKRWTGTLPTSVSGEARKLADEISGPVPRADRKRFEESQYVRTSDPKVSQHVAGAIAKNLLDTEAAVRELKPELNAYEVSQVAAKLQKDPHVQAAVQTELKRLGLDAESKEKYIQLLWRYAASEAPEDEKRQLTSLRLLSKAFLPEQIQIDEPEPLPLRNLDEGLKRMGLVPANAGGLDDAENESVNFDAWQNRKTEARLAGEETPVEMFKTSDAEVVARLRDAYYPALIHVTRFKDGPYLVGDVEKRGKEIAISVQAEREELRKQNADPDKVFAKRREERAEALAAR